MTRPTRRDKDVRMSSVIAGLRLEPDTATRLVESAKAHAADHNLAEVNIAAYARHLLRVGLGMGAAESMERELAFTKIAKAKRALNDSIRAGTL